MGQLVNRSVGSCSLKKSIVVAKNLVFYYDNYGVAKNISIPNIIATGIIRSKKISLS